MVIRGPSCARSTLTWGRGKDLNIFKTGTRETTTTGAIYVERREGGLMTPEDVTDQERALTGGKHAREATCA